MRKTYDNPRVRLLGLALAATLSVFPMGLVAQQGSGDGQAGPPQDSGPPTVDIPLIGEVPVPGFIAAMLGLGGDEGQAGPGQGEQPPPAVVWTPAETRAVAETFDFLGRIAPIEVVGVQTRVPGFIERVAFSGGQTVAEGDVLFEIEATRYEAELQSAKASAESARAQLTAAQRSLERAQELRESGTVSVASLDEATAAFESASGTLSQAEAAVRQAELDLAYTTIAAPISGRMSAPLQTRGNFVDSTTGEIAELTQMDPIWGVFALGETRLIEWQRLGIGGEPGAAAADDTNDNGGEPAAGQRVSGDGYRLSLLLPDGSVYDDTGSLSFIGSSVDPATGTVDVRVEFPNPDGLLLPNQNVTLRVTEADPPEFPVIPQAAVQLGRDGRAVWVVKEDDTVARVPISVRPSGQPGEVAVTEGLSGGERVIVRGTMNLQDAAKVDPRRASDAPGASTQ
ncbi:efflux RND transporter periplasmic adaptor subunit [Palleronia rufa]|uniref:efflux RND transporter periplasmic adaptor subunit n=1 Tax=Palleronia rufa TaxID=1530186 RepID=UPI00068CE812|nr:efflux RND transporter periplasmic adaptor subunit [Palleronia rufa]